jgi:hypothetical protein
MVFCFWDAIVFRVIRSKQPSSPARPCVTFRPSLSLPASGLGVGCVLVGLDEGPVCFLPLVVRCRFRSCISWSWALVRWVWSPLSVDTADVACRLPEISDMSMRSENYRVRDKELTELLDSAALSFVVSYVFVFVESN